MRFLSFLTIFLFICKLVFADQTLNGKLYQQVDNKWYQVENGTSYLVDENIITVKFKSSASYSAKYNFGVGRWMFEIQKMNKGRTRQ